MRYLRATIRKPTHEELLAKYTIAFCHMEVNKQEKKLIEILRQIKHGEVVIRIQNGKILDRFDVKIKVDLYDSDSDYIRFLG